MYAFLLIFFQELYPFIFLRNNIMFIYLSFILFLVLKEILWVAK